MGLRQLRIVLVCSMALAALIVSVVLFHPNDSGSGLDSNVLVQVGDQRLTRSELETWQLITSRLEPSPPAVRRERALERAIISLWTLAEAQRRHIDTSVSADELEQEVSVLLRSGLRLPDSALQALAEANIMNRRLEASVMREQSRSLPPVPEREIRAYYRQHLADFSEPFRVRLDVVYDTPRQLRRIRSLLDQGHSWSRVVTKDKAVDTGFIALSVTPRQVRDQLRRGPHGIVVGPVKFGRKPALLRLTDHRKARRRPFSEVREIIRTRIRDERLSSSVRKVYRQMERYWKLQTQCRQDYVIHLCEDGPPLGPRSSQAQPPR